jgi:hypothetical protein
MLLTVTFYLQSIYFQGAVLFCQLATIRVRILYWSSAKFSDLPTETLDRDVLCVVLCINFNTFNVPSNFNILFLIF